MGRKEKGIYPQVSVILLMCIPSVRFQKKKNCALEIRGFFCSASRLEKDGINASEGGATTKEERHAEVFFCEPVLRSFGCRKVVVVI